MQTVHSTANSHGRVQGLGARGEADDLSVINGEK